MKRIQPEEARTASRAGEVTLRPATPDDAAGLAAMLRLLSPSTAFLRFLVGLGEPSPWMVRGLLATGPRRGAVLAVLPGGTVVGHACWSVDAGRFSRDGEPPAGHRSGGREAGVCDLGVVVADWWQGQGLGTALVSAAAASAAAAGGRLLHLDIHPENRRLLASLRRRLPGATRRFADGLVTVQLPLADAI